MRSILYYTVLSLIAAVVGILSYKKSVCIISEPAGYLHNRLWLDMVITSSESGQRLLVTIWFYCVSGFATSVVNCGTIRVPKGLPM
jgi:hypothetical protein